MYVLFICIYLLKYKKDLGKKEKKKTLEFKVNYNGWTMKKKVDKNLLYIIELVIKLCENISNQ